MELQRAADSNNMKGFYNGLKEVWGPKKKGPVQLKSTDGMETFSDSKKVVARWSEHFQKLLNVPGDIDHEALDNIPQRTTKTSLDEIPTMDEMARAIASLKDGKAPGEDGIPAKVWKHGGDNLFSRLHQLITNAWEMGSVPQAWKDANIVTIYKKGDRTDGGNYRGISLLSIAGKIFARILLNRLSTHITPEVVPETQCGFRGNRSTVDMICCLRQLQEKCIEQDRPLYMVFVDFSKGLDTVGRTGLWQLLKKYGCPEKFTTMIEALHTGMMATVNVGGEVSESFRVTNGSSKAVYWRPPSFPSSYQQCSTMLSETWGMASTYSPDRALTYSTSHTTGEKAACLHDATSAFDHEDNLDGQSDKQGNTRTDRAAIYGRFSDQKESPVDWTPHEDVIRQATEAGSLLPTVFWSQKERAPSSPVQRYH